MADTMRPKVRPGPYGYTLTLVPGAREGAAAYSSALWSDDGAVPGITKELVFLRTSHVNRCATCFTGHVASAKRRGMTAEQIAAITAPEQWTATFNAAEIAALELATRMCDHADDLGTELIARLKEHYSDQQLAELILVAGQANMNNRSGNAAKQLLPQR
jgi:AhpD family alkylhydroperoxidase